MPRGKRRSMPRRRPAQRWTLRPKLTLLWKEWRWTGLSPSPKIGSSNVWKGPGPTRPVSYTHLTLPTICSV
eukprot:1434410-Prorocentrum_lima.AAC.1